MGNGFHRILPFIAFIVRLQPRRVVNRCAFSIQILRARSMTLLRQAPKLNRPAMVRRRATIPEVEPSGPREQ